jgi:hypothetical protein
MKPVKVPGRRREAATREPPATVTVWTVFWAVFVIMSSEALALSYVIVRRRLLGDTGCTQPYRIWSGSLAAQPSLSVTISRDVG